jgi:hypothetical protein
MTTTDPKTTEASAGDTNSVPDASSPQIEQDLPSAAAATQNPPPIAPAVKEERVEKRNKMVSGRAKVSVQPGLTTFGRVVDISLQGLGVILDEPVAPKKACWVHCELLLNGKPIALSVRAVVIYSILSRDKGFKTGLRFESLDAAATELVTKLST